MPCAPGPGFAGDDLQELRCSDRYETRGEPEVRTARRSRSPVHSHDTALHPFRMTDTEMQLQDLPLHATSVRKIDAMMVASILAANFPLVDGASDMSLVTQTVSFVSRGLFMPWTGPLAVTVHLNLWQLLILLLLLGLLMVGLWLMLCAVPHSLMRAVMPRPCSKDAARSDKMTQSQTSYTKSKHLSQRRFMPLGAGEEGSW